MKLNTKEKIILEFIIKSAKTDIDLRWKLDRYIKYDDLSFLGKSISELERRIMEENIVKSVILSS